MNYVFLFYGACVAVTLGLALFAQRKALIELGFILLTAWVGCNLAVMARGFTQAPMLIPTIDAILALCVAGITIYHQSKAAAWVFGLFVAVQLVHVVAFQLQTQGSYFYFLALNVLFLCQLAVVGGTSVAILVGRLAPTPGMADRFSRGRVFPRRRARGG